VNNAENRGRETSSPLNNNWTNASLEDNDTAIIRGNDANWAWDAVIVAMIWGFLQKAVRRKRRRKIGNTF